MWTVRRWIRVTTVLSVVSLFFLFLSFLALMDIAGGRESDLLLEWMVVWLSMVLFGIALFGTLLVLTIAGRKINKLEKAGSLEKIDHANS